MSTEPNLPEATLEIILDRIDTLALSLDRFSQDLDRMWIQITSSLEALDRKIDRLIHALQEPERRFLEGAEEETESKPS